MLLDNAMKFTHPLAFKGAVPSSKARVTIIISMTPREVTFTVEDTGIGIPAYQAEIIFTEFVQLDEYTDGTGIGLSIARSLAQHMHGNVELDTSYIGGARFIMTLPL
jgi:signal transduction histidine kinase